MSTLDQLLLGNQSSSTSIPLVDAGLFFAGLKKIAEGMPAEEPQLASPFAVPVPQVVDLLAQMISNEFKTQVYYVFYANMLRGLSHEGLAEEFIEHAKDELEHAKYLLRRLSVIQPGGVPIPPYEPPQPMTDPNEIVKTMIVVEQMGLSLWKQLLQAVGDDPMKYTIEDYLRTEEEHQDELWQHVEMQQPATAPQAVAAPEEQAQPEPAKTQVKVETSAPQPQDAGQKIAAILDAAQTRKQASFQPRASAVRAARDAARAAESGQRMHLSPGVLLEGLVDSVRRERSATKQRNVAAALGVGGTAAAGAAGYQIGKRRGEKEKAAADLTAASRAQIDDQNFVFPAQRKYPIHDKDHALAALGMVAMHGTASEKTKVRGAVEAKYPGLVKKAEDAEESHLGRNLLVAGGVGLGALGAGRAAFKHLDKRIGREVNRAGLENLFYGRRRAVEAATAAAHKAHKVRDFGTAGAALLGGAAGGGLGYGVSRLTEKKAAIATYAELLRGGDPAAYIEQERSLAAQQAMAESAHSRTVAMQASQAAQQAQAEAQAAQQQLQQAQQQVEQLSQQLGQTSQQTMMSTQQAAEAEARAAQHSIDKMQLGMRINQVRQELANLVMQDPVSESAGTVSDLAAQGQPATPMQQQQAEQMAQQQAAGGPSADAQQQAQEAQNAQADADQQNAQAQAAQNKDEAKGKGGPGTHVTVKTSGLLDAVRKYAGVVDRTGREAGKAFAEGVGEAVSEGAKKYAPHALAAAGIGTSAAMMHGAHSRQQRKRDLSDAIADGMRRSKTASPADRRMAQEIMGGPMDTLGHSLIDVLRQKAPGAAGAAAADNAMHGVGNAVKGVAQDVAEGHGSELLAQLRPHIPGLVVGTGLGVAGHKMLSGNGQPQQQPQLPPYYYT